MRIIVLFNLKTDADPDAYRAWATSEDLPGVRALNSVDDFQVYRTTGLLGSAGSPPYEYVEVIDVADMDAFGVDVSSETVQKTAAQFRQFADDPVFILTEPL